MCSSSVLWGRRCTASRHLRSREDIELTDDILAPFLGHPAFRSIHIHDCSGLSPQVLRLVTEQPDLDRLHLAEVPPGLQDMELGNLHRMQSLNVQGSGITSSFLKTLRSRRFFVSFGPQQGHVFDRGRRGYRGFYQSDPIRPSPFGIESAQLQLHSTSPGFDGMLVSQWLKRDERTGEDGVAELRVRIDLVAVESVVFAEYVKIQNPSRCFLVVHDGQVSLKDHQFAGYESFGEYVCHMKIGCTANVYCTPEIRVYALEDLKPGTVRL